jgi:Tfp pilus assembly protein PilO
MELANLLSRHKNKILNINFAIIVLALIFANNIYKKQVSIIETFKQNKDIETKKNGVLGNISQLEKKINAYKNYLNKKDMSLVMSRINNIAKDSGVKIISFRPQTETDYPVYVKYSFSLAVNFKDYNSLGRFMSKIENSPDVYMVDSINIEPLSQGQEEKGETNKITVDLVLSTILFKD